ncbi:hypothetical protein P8452_71103 [Trifolium repens]|nr:hypothetical protein P8452_71103 [Trifolium repens]
MHSALSLLGASGDVGSSQKAELIRATLSTIHVFISWIPLGFIFESPLLETLLKFFPVPAYRNLTLQCLTEVASLQFESFYDVQSMSRCMAYSWVNCRAYSRLPQIYLRHMQMALPKNNHLYRTWHCSSPHFKSLLFMQVHIRILDSTQENISNLLLGLEYLINISYVDDTEVFKDCLDPWNSLVSELFEPH